MEKVLYKEEQRFGQLWIMIPLYIPAIGSIIFFGYQIIQQLIIGRPWGDHPMSDTGLVIFFCFNLAIWAGILFLFEKSKLITNFYEKEIRLRFPPFISKEKIITMEEIARMEVRKYNPIWEFGGWGIRHGIKGKAYNVRGNMGLQLYFKNGKRLLIGTQKPEQVKWAINKMLSQIDENIRI